MDWKSGPLPVYTEFIRVYKTFINRLIIFKPRTALADLEGLHYFIAEAINHLSRRSGRISVYRKAGKYHSFKFSPRPPITSLRFHRARRSDGCEHSQLPARSADEYGVRGRCWMDCIGRMVMRPSVSGERRSACLLCEPLPKCEVRTCQKRFPTR